MKPKDTHDPESVTAFIQKLPVDFAALVESVRKTVLSAHPLIGEQIKWNSPAFFYTGHMPDFDPKTYQRDLLVIHTRKNVALLVFPTGTRITDPTGILEGDYKDGRRMVTINNMAELEAKAEDLKTVIKLWVEGIG